jgi:hypothetical protein
MLMFRTTAGLIFFYSYSRLDFSDMAGKGLPLTKVKKCSASRTFFDLRTGLVRELGFGTSGGYGCTEGRWRQSGVFNAFPHASLSPNAQVSFLMSAADEVQNERHQGNDEKNMNQPARHMKNNPAKNPSNH